jgi:DNA polymerase V
MKQKTKFEMLIFLVFSPFMKAIVDCNSFYCACEKLFRPDLLHKPVVVLSNNDGCIVSRTDEAKKLGIEMAVPYFMSKQVIAQHGVAVFSSNYHLYGDISWRVMDTLRQLVGADKVEVYSVDECFIDLEEAPADQLQALSLRMKDTVEQWTGIPVSIGVAPTKVLAKVANRLAKKNKQATQGIVVLNDPATIMDALQRTGVGDLWGVGGRSAYKLQQLGISDAWQLRNMNEEWARKNLGGVVGMRLIRELRGEKSIMMKEELVEKKMIATTRMFGRQVKLKEEVKEAVATYTSRAAEKLRRQYSATSTISVFAVTKQLLQANDTGFGSSISRQRKLNHATANTNELIKVAMEIVDEIFMPGEIYKKAGVMFSDIVPDASIQGNLFVDASSNNNRMLMNALDNINFSMRDDVVKFASTGTKRDWKMRQELRSGRYTTRWKEIFLVK